jgi:hypothetical protein
VVGRHTSKTKIEIPKSLDPESSSGPGFGMTKSRSSSSFHAERCPESSNVILNLALKQVQGLNDFRISVYDFNI